MNLIDVVYKYAKGNDPIHAHPHEIERRRSICAKCPLNGKYVKGFCGEPVIHKEGCGCNVHLKTQYQAEICPDYKW